MGEFGVLLQSFGPQISFFGLVVGGFFLVFRGLLIPKITLDSLTTQWEMRLQEREREVAAWKTAHDKSEIAREEIQSSLQEVLEQQRTVVRLVQSLPGVQIPTNGGGQT